MDYIELVSKLNEELYDKTGYEFASFHYTTNGYVDVIYLYVEDSKISLWDSENGFSFDDESNEDFAENLIKELDKRITWLAAISNSFKKDIMSPAQQIANVGDRVMVLETSKYGLQNQGNEIDDKYIGNIYKVIEVYETEIEVDIDGGYTLAHDEYKIIESV